MARGGKKLTASQRKFKILYLEAIAKTGERPECTRIAIAAGYSPKYARHRAVDTLLRHPSIGPDIEAALQEAEDRARAGAIESREKLLVTLSKQARGDEPTEIQVIDSAKNGRTVKKVVRKGDAIDKLCRMNGYYAPEKQEVTNRDAVDEMTEEELDAYIARQKKILRALED